MEGDAIMKRAKQVRIFWIVLFSAGTAFLPMRGGAGTSMGQFDYGDAPDASSGTATGDYNTTLADGGPQHALGAPSSPRLGACVDSDSGALQDVPATADDATASAFVIGGCVGGDDEDGVAFSSPFAPGSNAMFSLSVGSTSPCVINAWVDWNQNGTFGDSPGEQIATDVVVPFGPPTVLSPTVPLTAVPGFTYARFRCANGGGLAPTGPATSGEVEDYRVEIAAPTATTTPTNIATITPTNVATITPTETPVATATPSIAQCPAFPASGCATSVKAQLQLRKNASDAKDKLKWKFSGGPALVQSDFGDPLTTASYALCIYDGSALKAELQVAASGTLWSSKGTKGYQLKDPGGTNDGVTKVKLSGGAAGKSKLQMKGKGAGLPMPVPVSATQFFDNLSGVTAQLREVNGDCYETAFTPAQVIKNDGTQLKAKK